MDDTLKQRLVGAIVLVALGVIFIPILLEGPNQTLVPEMDDMPTPETHAPELPLKPFPPIQEPVQAERAVITDATAAETVDKPGPVVPKKPEKPAQAKTAPAPVVAPPKPAEEPVKVGKPATVVPAGSWIVQVVSLSNKANALALRDKLRKGSFATQVEQVRVDGKTRYRVRVGPFLKRMEADQVRKQIAERFEQNGRVMSWP
ncbi:hypothetical protein MNBD_GAMMA15-816 [hydrothermal vent metagenome]|uniref:SPOR domain-containing protein n=1 Tax=hydrothermal vent metagenome TaxID=652676 RepID=A0A3B0Z2M8_9ZZZZ